MNLITFYKEHVSENIPLQTKVTLGQMGKTMQRNLGKKCYMFSIKNEHLFSHTYTNTPDAIRVLTDGYKVAFITSIKQLVEIYVKQIKASIPSEKELVIENYNKHCWLLNLKDKVVQEVTE